MSNSVELATGVPGIVVRLEQVERFTFGSFVDCNMAAAWVGESLRIFPGK
ncbi:MAG: hypothetical protein ABL886_05825 [Rhodoglobus sp.]